MTEEKQASNSSKVDINQQEKLKNKVDVNNRDEEIKQMSSEKLRTMLSNKNESYVYRLEKELVVQGNLSEKQASEKVDDLLVEIVISQHHGQPARNLFGFAPKIQAAQMLKPKEIGPEDVPSWQYVVESALLYIAIFVGLFGIIGLFQNSKNSYNSQMGILTLVSVGAIMGIFMTKYNDWVLPSASDKSKKIPWKKVIFGMLGMLVVLFVWMWLLQLPALRVINPVLPGVVNIIVAVISYGLRWAFRKHYHIKWSTFTRTSSSK